ncbi:ABC transporter permease [Ruegeria sp. 2205SS24-7]|uniref:ABC transporter permease n=1 Tax=Ruegeria discodermiae TaxID=3064389 RepID=UPI0027404A64|nr:ABC transporter permease [Ruegeria sp. 2205SS24-7]MDP5218719.1 ABC transporter permease [Ruegeria sp. 2205SS24-7]
MIDLVLLGDVLAGTARLGTPIAFAALGGVIAERGGLYNIGLEGQILAGALGAAAGSFATGSAMIGLGCGIICGLISGLLLGYMSIRLRINQLVGGIALNLLLAGLTAFLSRQIFGAQAGGARVNGFSQINIPFLSDLPVVGPSLFSQDPLFYLLIGLAIAAWFWLMKSHKGLDLRAVGENPKAADLAGVPVFRMQYLAIAVSGALAALAGVQLVLSQVYVFAEGMSAGKGFIALAAIILGRWSPIGAICAALFFGFCDAVQFKLQFTSPEIPYQLFLILPYLASLVALVVLGAKASAPASVGLPYDREHR